MWQITELVHQRDITRMLIRNKVQSPKSFDWLMQMRMYFDPKNPDVLQQLSIQMANAKFNYGFEYLGVQDKLVQTPLTDRCYLSMTQALEARLGGSPFGMLCFRGAKSQCCVCLKIEDVVWWHLSWMVLIFKLFSEGMGAVWFSCGACYHFPLTKQMTQKCKGHWLLLWYCIGVKDSVLSNSFLQCPDCPMSLWLIIFDSCAFAERHCLCLKCCLAVCSGKIRQCKVIHLMLEKLVCLAK